MTTRSAQFELAIPTVLRHEGGYVNHPADPGGETNMGITKRTYPKLDIKNLTVEQAKDIYYRDFWLKGPYEKLKDPELATKVFDTAVNTGNKRAFIILQVAAMSCGLEITEFDGKITDELIEDINELPRDRILFAFRNEQAAWYEYLAHTRPSMKVFLKGWLRRAYS